MINFSVSILAAFGLQALIAAANVGTRKQRRITIVCIARSAAMAIAGAALVGAGLFKDTIVDFMLASRFFGNSARQISLYVDREIYPALTGSCLLFAVFAPPRRRSLRCASPGRSAHASPRSALLQWHWPTSLPLGMGLARLRRVRKPCTR